MLAKLHAFNKTNTTERLTVHAMQSFRGDAISKSTEEGGSTRGVEQRL